MSGTNTIDSATLDALRAAGITEQDARRYVEAERQHGGDRTLADALSSMAQCKAPASLLGAYARANAPAARIFADIVRHVDVRGGTCSLPAHAVRLIEARLAAEPGAKTYIPITAAHGRS